MIAIRSGLNRPKTAQIGLRTRKGRRMSTQNPRPIGIQYGVCRLNGCAGAGLRRIGTEKRHDSGIHSKLLEEMPHPKLLAICLCGVALNVWLAWNLFVPGRRQPGPMTF